MLVRVYWNRIKKVWSVMDRATRRVMDHRQEIVLTDARFVVSAAGRRRTLRTGRRTVHAYVEGKLARLAAHSPACVRITYNPFQQDSFQVVASGRRIDQAPVVWFTPDGVFIARRHVYALAV